jgi:hypothetical protein
LATSLDTRFRSFLVALPGVECIDHLPEYLHVDGVRRADFLLRGRTVIAEVKALEDSREGAVTKLISRFKRNPRWRAPPRTMDWPDVCQLQPHGNELREEVFTKVTDVLKGAFDDARAQIRDTKLHLQLPHARGLLILLNANAYIMDLKAAAQRISRLLWCKPGVPRPEYSMIDGVLVVSDVEKVILEDGTRNDPCLVIVRSGADAGEAHAAADELITGWAMLNRQGLVMDREPRDEAALSSLRVVSTRPKFDV